ncbi:MAG: YfhO family protein, partial [Syntrophomonadaceae bacterium]
VRLVARSPSRVALEARAPAPAVLVLLDAWESGWSARLDGADAPVLRADGAFRAVRVPAGAHRVEFVYFPPRLFEGLALGAVGILGCLLAALKLRPGAPKSI